MAAFGYTSTNEIRSILHHADLGPKGEESMAIPSTADIFQATPESLAVLYMTELAATLGMPTSPV